jgi:hypothetical protein
MTLAGGAAGADPLPSLPGAGYTLDWENPSDWAVPGHPPRGWALEYRPEVRHADGEPQVRVANAAAGEPVRDGQHSVRFDLAKGDPALHNGARAELGAEDPVEPPGAERWYGFSLYLPSSWKYDQAPEVVMQWHQVGGECSNGCSPPLSLITQKGKWVLSQNWEISPGHWSFVDTPIGDYATGRWTDWVVHVKWSLGGDGVLDVWRDGQPVPGFFHKTGRNDDYGERANGNGNYAVLGIYKWPWSQGKPSDTARRIMYVDAVRIADQGGSYAAVAPGAQTPTSGHLSVSSPLRISPGASTAATFTVTNDGCGAVSIAYFLAGARDAQNAHRDFPASAAMTLQPGQSYTYRASRALAAGAYTAWPAYYDGNDWRELGPHTSFTVP